MTLVASAFLFLNSSRQDFIGAVNLNTSKALIVALVDCNRRLDNTEEGYEGLATSPLRVISDDKGLVILDCAGGFGALDRSTGEAVKFSFKNSGLRKFRKVAPGAGIAAAVAEGAFFDLLRLVSFPLKVEIASSQLQGKEDGYFQIIGTLVTGERPMSPEYCVQAQISASAGQLISLWLPVIPKLEHAMEKVLPETQLREAAMEAYQRQAPLEDGVIAESRLVLEIPRYEKPSNVTAEHEALARDRQAIPVWRLMMIRRSEQEVNAVRTVRTVSVDARDGRVLKVVATG